MQKNLVFRGGLRVKNLASSNEDRVPSIRMEEIVTALLSRDYKGLSNYESNAVIEIYKVEKNEDK